jgi:hypothetical protein
MSFQIVYPIAMTINAGSFKEAVKQYVKMNYDVNIANIIITDQYRHMKANLKYYNEGPKNKVGISLYPTVWPIVGTNSLAIAQPSWPYSTEIRYDTKEFPKTTFVESPMFVPNIVPINPLGSTFSALSPVVSDVRPYSDTAPFIPRIGPIAGVAGVVAYY